MFQNKRHELNYAILSTALITVFSVLFVIQCIKLANSIRKSYHLLKTETLNFGRSGIPFDRENCKLHFLNKEYKGLLVESVHLLHGAFKGDKTDFHRSVTEFEELNLHECKDSSASVVIATTNRDSNRIWILSRGVSNDTELFTMSDTTQEKYGDHLIHRGALKYFARLCDGVTEAVSKRLTSIGANNTHLVFTGHSMGGALSVLFAHELQQRLSLSRGDITCVTYGTPRFASPAFSHFSGNNISTIRVVNESDPICFIPPAKLDNYSYAHVGEMICYFDYMGSPGACHCLSLYLKALEYITNF